MSNKCFCHLTVNGEAYEVKDAKARANIEEIAENMASIEDHVTRHCNEISNIYNVISAFHSWTLQSATTLPIQYYADSDYSEATFDTVENISAIMQRANTVVKIVLTVLDTDSEEYYITATASYNLPEKAGTEVHAEGFGSNATLLFVTPGPTAENAGLYGYMAGEGRIAQNGGKLQIQVYTKEL